MIGRRGFLGGLLACFGLAKAAPITRDRSEAVRRPRLTMEGQFFSIHCRSDPIGEFSIVHFLDGRSEIWLPDDDRISIPATKEVGETFLVTSERGRKLLVNQLDEHRFLPVAAECV